MKKHIGQILVCIIGIGLLGGISYLGAASFNQSAKVQVETMNVETMNFSEDEEVVTGDFVGGLTGTTHFTYDVEIGEALSVGSLTQGNGVLALATSSGTTVLTEAQLISDNYLEIMVNTDTTATLTLPATSTMTTIIPTAGDTREWLIHNATSSTMALTIAAGTGIDLIGVTTNDDIIDATEYSSLKCYRQTDTDVTCIISELLHVD